MKKFIMTSLIMLTCITSYAQAGKSLYNKYSGKEGVSAVYISTAMFDILKSMPDVTIEDKDVNFSNIIRSLDGMYILDIGNSMLAKELASEVDTYIRSGKFQLLMEAKEETEAVRIYIISEKDAVRDLLLVSTENNGENTSVISISGSMSLEDLQTLLAD